LLQYFEFAVVEFYAMYKLIKLLCITALLSLMGCKDILNKPLASMDRPTNPGSLEGGWVAKSQDEQLDIIQTNEQDWYQFTWQQNGKITEGRFVVAYFKYKRVLNIDLASLKVNGNPVVDESQSAYVLVGAYLDNNELELAPADMGQFEKHFSKYFFASPITAANLCLDQNPECAAAFTSGNLLISKRMKKFNDDFLKKYRNVFPNRQKVLYLRQ
jgi:hypothetical protein